MLSAVCAVLSAVCAVRCAVLCAVRCALCYVRCALYSLLCALCSLLCVMCALLCVLCSAVCAVLSAVCAVLCCVLCVSRPSGTGKTHTMEGKFSDNPDCETAGMIPRAVHAIFQRLREAREYSIKVSFMEIYNEELSDLTSDDESVKLRVFDDPVTQGTRLLVPSLSLSLSPHATCHMHTATRHAPHITCTQPHTRHPRLGWQSVTVALSHSVTVSQQSAPLHVCVCAALSFPWHVTVARDCGTCAECPLVPVACDCGTCADCPLFRCAAAVKVDGLEEKHVSTATEVFSILLKCLDKRRSAATLMNEHSRSQPRFFLHAVERIPDTVLCDVCGAWCDMWCVM